MPTSSWYWSISHRTLPLSTPEAGEPQARPIWHLQVTTHIQALPPRTLLSAERKRQEVSSCSKTALRVHNGMLADKNAANEFAHLCRRESTLPLTSKRLEDMKQKLSQEEKQEHIPNPCLNSTLNISELNSAIRNLFFLTIGPRCFSTLLPKPSDPGGFFGLTFLMAQYSLEISSKGKLQGLTV